MKKIYFVNYTEEFFKFLTKENVDFIRVGDVLMIRLEAINDSPFALLILQFAEYLIDQNHNQFIDTSLN